MAESAVKDVEETICKNALRELYEAMENLCDAIGEAMALIADAFFQTVRPVLDSILNLIGIGAIVAARVYAAASRKELYYMTRAKKLRVRKKYYNRVKKRIARRKEIKA